MDNYDKFIKKAIKLGASEAKIIKTESIITSAWVRWKCRYGCDGYNSSLCCPPNTPNFKETRELLDSYDNAILLHFKSDNLGGKDPKDVAVTLERDIFLAGFYKAFALGCGPCRWCDECSMDVCRHAEKARPSMESCGIDVYSTARNNGYFIEVVKNHSSPINRYALVLIE
jgi:predicted metal-binding protein